MRSVVVGPSVGGEIRLLQNDVLLVDNTGSMLREDKVAS